MTKETVIKMYKRFCELAEKGGDTKNPVHNELIKSDALRHKTAMENKMTNDLKEKAFPYLTEKKEVKKETKENG